jgi:hypothetical protein
VGIDERDAYKTLWEKFSEQRYHWVYQQPKKTIGLSVKVSLMTRYVEWIIQQCAPKPDCDLPKMTMDTSLWMKSTMVVSNSYLRDGNHQGV